MSLWVEESMTTLCQQVTIKGVIISSDEDTVASLSFQQPAREDQVAVVAGASASQVNALSFAVPDGV